MIVSGAPIGKSAIFLTVFASMGGFLFGYDTGQIADITPLPDFLRRFGQPNGNGGYYLTDTREGLIVGLLSIGTLGGALIASNVADMFGRRWAMSIASLFVCIGIIIQLTSTDVWQQFAMGRFTAGLGVGCLSATVPMYQSEIAPKQIRGALVGTYQLFITMGVLIAYCFGIGTREINGAGSWRTLIGIGMVFAAILGIGIQFMPESPRWLIARGRREEAMKALCRVRGVTVEANDYWVDKDYNAIIEQLELDEKHGKGGWLECFGPKLVKRTILGILLQMFQQLTGTNYFLYYGATIFAGTGLKDSYVTQIILGVVNMVCTLPGLWALERFGRRKCLIIGGLWQSAWLWVYGAAGTAVDPSVNEGIGKLMIVATCMFLVGFSSTWGPGVWIQTSEMFPNRSRAKMQAMSVSSNWIWNFLLAFFTPFITSDIGFSLGFVFAGCNLAGALIVYFFVKEGQGLSLEQNQQMWEDSVPAWRSSKWAPPGYSSRKDAIASKEKEEKEPSETSFGDAPPTPNASNPENKKIGEADRRAVPDHREEV